MNKSQSSILPFFNAFCNLCIQQIASGSYRYHAGLRVLTGTMQGSGKTVMRRKDRGGPLHVFATSSRRAGDPGWALGKEWRAMLRVTIAAEATGICD